MKQFLFMIGVCSFGTYASLTQPFWGILMYYAFAVLRPQYMWKWAFPIELRWSLFAALVAIASMGLNLSTVMKNARMNMVTGIMTIYGLMLTISIITAYDTVTAQHWGIEYLKIILMIFLATMVIKELWQVRLVALVIMLMLGYVAWEINSLYIFDNRLDIFHNGYGNLDNNGAGLMLGMGIPFAYAFAVSAPRHWQRGLCWFLAVLMLHAILMSYSRGAMLATAVGGIWLLIHHRPRLQIPVIAAVLFIAISVLAGQEIRDRFISTTNYSTDYSAQSRLASWRAGWELALQRPLIGQGIRNSNQFVYNYGADRQGRTIHNQFLQVAADSGIPAAGMYILMLIVAMVFLYRSKMICRHFLWQAFAPPGIQSPNQNVYEIDQAEKIALACQASMIIFICGGVFLSLELVELPWILLMLAGIMPSILHRHIGELSQAAQENAPHHNPPKHRLLRPIRPALPTAMA